MCWRQLITYVLHFHFRFVWLTLVLFQARVIINNIMVDLIIHRVYLVVILSYHLYICTYLKKSMDKECKGYDMNFKWVIRLPPLLHQTWVDYELYLAYDDINSIETWGGSGYFRSGRYVVTSQFVNYIGLLIAYLFEDIARIFLAMITTLLPPHLMSGVLITGRLLKSDQHISLLSLLFALR